MMLFEVQTTFKTLFVVSKNEWEVRDKADSFLKSQVTGGSPYMITDVKEVASTVDGRMKSILVL